jgi:zinc protease
MINKGRTIRSFIIWGVLIITVANPLGRIVLPVLAEGGGSSPSSVKVKAIKKVFDNGLVLLIKPNPANEVVAVSVFTRMGSLYEPRERAGISVLTQRLITRGTSTRNSREIANETESVGATIKSGAGFDYGIMTLTTTLVGLDKGLDVLLDEIQNPVFPADQFEKERQMILDQIASRNDQPSDTAFITFLEAFYKDHPYGMLPTGSAAVVKQLTREDLLSWHKKVYLPNNMVISVVGKVDPVKITKLFQDTLGKLPKGQIPARVTVDLPIRDKSIQTFKQRKSEAVFMVLGYPAPDLMSKDVPAMDVLNGILGGGMSSRLFVELRDKKGLAYSISSDYQKMLGPSCVYCFMATAPENLQAARDGIVAEFEKLTKKAVPAKELLATKRFLKGSYLMGHETNLDQANILGQDELFGLGYEYDERYPQLIDKVTAKDLQRIAGLYFKNYVLGGVSPGEVKE